MSENLSAGITNGVKQCLAIGRSMPSGDDMQLLIIVPKKHYGEDFCRYLTGEDRGTDIRWNKVWPPNLLRGNRLESKNQLVIVLVWNFLYLGMWLLLRFRKKWDAVMLSTIHTAIPVLFVLRLAPFLRPRRSVVVKYFYLHALERNATIRAVLRFILNNPKVVLVAQSPYEVKYYSGLTEPARVVYFPFCERPIQVGDVPEVSDGKVRPIVVSGSAGRGKEYVFAGGYTNRDYDCLMRAAREVDYQFLVICSGMNRLTETAPNVEILRDVSQDDFYSYMSNAQVVVIPLKEECGSSGQMSALTGMCLQRPVVYARLDCISQYFQDGVTGLGYAMGNAVELAAKIRILLSDPRLRQEMGERAYVQYNEKYHLQRYYEFLQTLVTD